MPRVTSVESQRKNPKRFNVYIDGKFAFGADEDLIVNFRILKNKELSPTDLEKLLFEAEVGKLMDRIYRLLGIRARSEKEIRDYFRVKNQESRVKGKQEVSDMVVDTLIEHLKRKGLLNDREFAKAWVESRRKSKKKGIIALKQELYQKGIDKGIIDEVTGVENLESSEQDLAFQSLERKLKSWSGLPSLEFKKKAYDFLMRRGFEYSVVREVIEKVMKKEIT